MLHDVLATVVSERAETKGEKKHYIPFTHTEFEGVRKAFNRPNLMPADLKTLILAMCEGKVTLTAVAKK